MEASTSKRTSHRRSCERSCDVRQFTWVSYKNVTRRVKKPLRLLKSNAYLHNGSVADMPARCVPRRTQYVVCQSIRFFTIKRSAGVTFRRGNLVPHSSSQTTPHYHHHLARQAPTRKTTHHLLEPNNLRRPRANLVPLNR